jgi:type IV secretion system protein TrbL
MRISRKKSLAVLLGIVPILLAKSALSQGTTDPQSMLQVFADASINWQTAIFPFALNLFKLLAAVDFTWTCILIGLEKSDFQALIAAIIKKLMGIGIFYALLIYAPQWFPSIIQSFVQVGGAASGTPTPLNPSDIFKMGMTIAGTLFNAASQTTSLLMGFATSLSLVFAAIIISASYIAITMHFILAMVESYLLVGAGYIFLGFGGSRWTSSYAERYVSQVISIGCRLMVLYLVIGLGQQFSTQWIAAAQVAATGATANISLAWTLAGQVAIYGLICWTVPKMVSSVIGGSIQASAGDVVGVGVAAATAAVSAIGLASGVGAPAAATGAASATSSVASAANASSVTNAATGASGFGAAGGSSGSGGSGSASFAPTGGGSGGTGGGGAFFGGGGSTSGSGGSATPPPPAWAESGSATAPSGGPAANGRINLDTNGSRPVATPPPPAHLEGKMQTGLDKTKDIIKSVHGSLPSDGAVASGPGLNIGHPTE